MAQLTRFDLAEWRGTLLVVVESALLPPDPSVVVIPLLRDYPAVKLLNPDIIVRDQRLVLATRLIAAVRRSALRRAGHIGDQSDKITRAIDILTSGF
jgi:toxin CcdB